LDVQKALRVVEENIEEIERAVYVFDNVLLPRAEADKKILQQLREQHMKLQAFVEARDRGEPLTNESVYNSIPGSFR
jgi:vacuolar-type H+-ATPase subunit D/Vma8